MRLYLESVTSRMELRHRHRLVLVTAAAAAALTLGDQPLTACPSLVKYYMQFDETLIFEAAEQEVYSFCSEFCFDLFDDFNFGRSLHGSH